MGASQSYQKANAQSKIVFQNDIDDLTGFLKNTFPTDSAVQSKIADDSDFFKKIRKKYYEKTNGDDSIFNDILDNLEKIKRSIDLIMLYDNYNLKNGVIIKDLSKKYNNQLAEIKKRTEYTDLINHDLNVIKNKINKNNKIDKTLLIFIILFVLLIIVLGFLTALKFVKV